MSAKSLLSFRFKGDYGHFGLRYATTSSPTHSIPPRHTLAGVIASILGIEREKVAEVFHPDQCDIGISVDSSISTLRVPIKLMKIKSRTAMAFHVPKEHNIVPYQFLRSPSYTIYFDHQDAKLKKKLRDMLIAHECVYPPAMGLAYLLADFEWLGDVDVEESGDGELKVISSFPVDEVKVYPETGNSVVFERFALYLDSGRRPYKFHRVMVDIEGSPISMKSVKRELAVPYTDKEGKTIFLW